MARLSYRQDKLWLYSMNLLSSGYQLAAQFPAEEKTGLAAAIKKTVAAIPPSLANAIEHQHDEQTHEPFLIRRPITDETETALKKSLTLLGDLSHTLDVCVHLKLAKPRQLKRFTKKCVCLQQQIKTRLRKVSPITLGWDLQDDWASGWQLKVLYDGRSRLCRRIVLSLRQHDPERQLKVVNLALHHEWAERLHLTPHEVQHHLFALEPDGSLHAGVEAIALCQRVLGFTGWHRCMDKPVVREVAELTFAVVAHIEGFRPKSAA